MQLCELLEIPELGLRALTGEVGLDRTLRRVFTTDLRDPGRYLSGDDLVLTGLIWHRSAADADAFVGRLVACGAGALGAGQGLLGYVPDDLVAACRAQGLPLFSVPADTSFATITEHVSRRLSGEWGSALARLLGRHRRMVTAVAEGAGRDALFGLLFDDLEIGCWLISPTGRVLAGTAPPPAPRVAARLARDYLAAERLPCTVSSPAVPGAAGRGTRPGELTVFPVDSGAGHRVTSWFLACAGAASGWPDELRESVLELVADIALERARLDAGAEVERRLAGRVVDLVSTGDRGSAELLSLLRTVGLDTGDGYLVVALGLYGHGGAGDAARLARATLDEIIRAGPGPDTNAVLCSVGDTTLALLALAAGPDGDDPTGRTADRVRTGAAALAPGLGALRLTVGVSDRAARTGGLHGAIEEALGACRLARARPDRASVVTVDEVDSHVLLLASVPDDVRRSFSDRLLRPLLDYDARHRSQLVTTLDAFLACSGSWNSCARRLHVHVNTLRYRIRRVEELTGRDLGALPDRVDFFLALRARTG